MKTLYLECNSGISGDMTVAALLDLGASEDVLRRGLESLNAGGYEIEIKTVKKRGICARDFNVIIHGHDDDHNHDHDHEHDNHGHDHEHSHEHGCHDLDTQKFGHEFNFAHDHELSVDHMHAPIKLPRYGQEFTPDHEHENDFDTHSHVHRGIADITAIIDGSEITDNAKATAKKIFDIIARAEAKIHGLPIEDVHFHEVGAIDSIVDIVGTAICVDNLGIERVICTPLREGQGTVTCQHGKMLVPAPATLEIAVAHNIPFVITPNSGEMVTPTGAAIVAALVDSFDAPGAVTVKKTGYGAGKKDFEVANVLRASLIDANTDGETDGVAELSCNIDDMTGEQLAYARDILLEQGALDCWFTPILMKKGRPAQTLSLLVDHDRKSEFTRLLFEHTTTIGVRYTPHFRAKMKREQKRIETRYGVLDVKECSFGDICKTSVEFESAKKLSVENSVPISQIYDAAKSPQIKK